MYLRSEDFFVVARAGDVQLVYKNKSFCSG